MPLFFFLSGLFIEQTAAKLSLGQFVTNKLQTIAYPYFVWSILQGSLKAATDRQLSRVTDLWRIIYDPQMQFWFLYVLFLGSIAYGVLRRGGISRSGYFAFCMALYACHVLSVDFGNSGILYTTRINLIYFGLGVIVTRERCDRLLSLCSTVGLNLVAIAGFAALAAMAFSLNLAKISPLATPLLAAVGIAASLAFARRVEAFSRLAFLHQWGLLSLQIYVAHTIASAAVRIFLQKGLKVSDPTVHIVLGTAVGIYAPIALAYACQKFDFPYLFSLRPAKKPQPRAATMVA
jgi:fucose 4-O-acetylase-like acetyltransferase